MGIIMDGKLIAEAYKRQIIDYVEERKKNNLRVPCLATIQVGDDGGTTYYSQSIVKLCNKLGLDINCIKFESIVSEKEVIEIIEKFNCDISVDGILVFLPLPSHINEERVTNALSPSKDVDGLTNINCGKLYKGEDCFLPCTPKAVIEMLKYSEIELQGKNAVVLGRSNIVGKPCAQLLLNENSTVTICHSKTKNIKEICSEADILVAAIGKPNYVTRDFVKEGVIVIDVGTSMCNGKITGDVNFDEVFEKAAYITPVPGGVGAMTTTMILKNVCEASKNNVY